MPSLPTLTNSLKVLMTKPKEKDGITKYQVYRRASPISDGTTKLFTCSVAHPLRSSNFSHIHGPSHPTRWQTIGFWWKKGGGWSKPERHFPFLGCEPRRRQRRPSGIPLYHSSQWSTGRPLHPVRRLFSSTIGVEGQVGGSDRVEEGRAGVEQGI